MSDWILKGKIYYKEVFQYHEIILWNYGKYMKKYFWKLSYFKIDNGVDCTAWNSVSADLF